MKIERRTGTISKIVVLTPTAQEVTITFPEALTCLPGSFVNVFMDINGVKVRRAFSVVHTHEADKSLTFAVRLSLKGTMSPEFWKDDVIGKTAEIMGPFGFNTADKLSHNNLFLFAFGIGAGVIRSIAEHALEFGTHKTITIVTGSRAENDIVYKEYFDSLVRTYPHVSVVYVISNPNNPPYPYTGYIQDHVGSFSFNDADVYMCGQEKACAALKEKIESTHPTECAYFVEAFH